MDSHAGIRGRCLIRRVRRGGVEAISPRKAEDIRTPCQEARSGGSRVGSILVEKAEVPLTRCLEDRLDGGRMAASTLEAKADSPIPCHAPRILTMVVAWGRTPIRCLDREVGCSRLRGIRVRFHRPQGLHGIRLLSRTSLRIPPFSLSGIVVGLIVAPCLRQPLGDPLWAGLGPAMDP